ncbi:alpha/beta fold hydrolase [Sphaerisporangium viridialbum]|uniref:alpha/beta fold hydrolase n=1 Tax=Sphaerisporangium viridialbum TaxID=46189 RepID=UPI003C78211B
MGGKNAKPQWRTGQVTSGDGTNISFLSAGDGPGLVVIPGNNRRAHHYEAMTGHLSREFTVHVIDRRGRGASGPQGSDYSVEREVDDAIAVIGQTRSERVFGHSYGGLVALRLGLRHRVAALAVYEPAVSIRGSFDGSWVPTFTRLLNDGKQLAAMTTFMKHSRLVPIENAPMIVFRGLAFMLLHGSDGAETRAMMHTTPAELQESIRSDSDGAHYSQLSSPTLLLGGSRSPSYLTEVLPQLADIIPNARHEIIDGLDHNAPDLNAPGVAAERITTFLADTVPAGE